MSNFLLFTAHTKAITPPFERPFLNATTHDGKTIRFLGVEHGTHGRNLTTIKHQGSPMIAWISELHPSNNPSIEWDVPPESVVAILPHTTTSLKIAIQNGETESLLKALRRQYPMLRYATTK